MKIGDEKRDLYDKLKNIRIGDDIISFFKGTDPIPDFLGDLYLENGLRAQQLIDSAYGDLEALVEQVNINPLDFTKLDPSFMERQGFFPVAVNLDYDNSHNDRGEPAAVIAMSVYNQEDGRFRDPRNISVRSEDSFIPALQELFPYDGNLSMQDLSFLLLPPHEYDMLINLSKDETERKRYLNEIDEDTAGNTFFNAVLAKAIKLNASDVHFEPLSHQDAQIRYRVDGVLHKAPITLSPGKLKNVLSAMKVAAHLDIAEKRKPQDNGMRYVAQGREYGVLANKVDDKGTEGETKEQINTTRNPLLAGRGFRVSTVPLNHGESGVVRILPEMEQVGLSAIGIPDVYINKLKDNMLTPNGIVLITGPTGSGKTTTLYSCLDSINDMSRKIITIEDPVEIDLYGVNQSPVNRSKDWDFGTATRHFMRQDPDIILIGELRDEVTAKAAVASAKTGHLTLATLHTNDSIESLLRLRDLGVSNADVYSTLQMIQAQRLVRKYTADESFYELYDASKKMNSLMNEDVYAPGSLQFLRPRSDVRENSRLGFGYSGRVPIMEIWEIGDTAKDLIYSGDARHSDFVKCALDSGMEPMVVHGMKRVLNRETSLDEVQRVIPKDEFKRYKSQIISTINPYIGKD